MAHFLNIRIVEGVAQAPNYAKGELVEGLVPVKAEAITAVIVPRGTMEGHCTVDLQFAIVGGGEVVGAAVAMVPGRLLLALADAIRGVEARQQGIAHKN